jgi:ABC-2 type transport system permease protein
MNKIFLIIRREYLTRVRKRTFIISTILFPVLYFGLIFGSGYIAKKSATNLHVAIIDSSGYFDKGAIERENIKDSSSILTLVDINSDSLGAGFKNWGYDGYLIIPANLTWESVNRNSFILNTGRTIGIGGVGPVQAKLNNIWNIVKNEKLGIDENKKSILEKNTININTVNINDTSANSGVATVIGYVSGFLIYFILLLYGSQVMMGVMEEKTNRIAEVVVSSVRPFQLMLGKIIGISLVALTQFLLWVAFVFVIYNATKGSAGGGGPMSGMIGQVQQVFSSINVSLIILCFIFYLLGGFFFYSALYAAIGSSVNEDMREAQSLSFPVTMLVILSIFMLGPVMVNPTGSLAVWASIIPFSSPIIMMARIPFGIPGTVPWWQLVASMVALIGGFIFTTWFAGKIYRTGILMYGKKPTWKEMMKWAFRKS